MDAARLTTRLAEHQVTLCVVGQGYVGLSLAAGAATAGMEVEAFDLQADRVASLAEGRNVVPGVSDTAFDIAFDTGRLHFTTDPSVVERADVIVICVPTPVTDHRPDLTYVEAAASSVGRYLRPDTLVILESTTYPGTTNQVVRPLLEAHGLRAGEDFLLAYSPERIDPGNPKYGLRNTPRVVGGHTAEATDAATTFYAQVVDEVVPLSSCEAAELAKLLENTFRMVNIALVNELAIVCGEQGIDTWEVIRAASTKPFGFMPFYPGPGVGGHCIPLDPAYLAWQSRRDAGRPFRLVETAQDINADMPNYVAQRVVDALNAHGMSVKGARVFALGVTYKPDIGDIRESAAIEVLAKLHRKGADVVFHDPFVARIDKHDLHLERSELTPEALQSADCVVLLTPHEFYDLDVVVGSARLLFDARNATGDRRQEHVVPL
jgi:nucleotide sugar dehydrogenase